jgi:regulator of cell morphogenesis and NO signaling
MNITPESRVGEIAAHHPMSTRVFDRHGIDFCCGGGIALRQACDRRGLDTPQILAEIEAATSSDDASLDRWDEASVEDLIHHIVDAYHVPLREELPRLELMAQKVVRVHGDKDPERFASLLETFLQLQSELEDHLQREEEVLFPAILQHAARSSIAIEPFVDDHSAAGQALARLRELTDGYRAPAKACNTWRALWHGLEELEKSLHHHIHLENNVLFPKIDSGPASGE